MFKFSLNDLPAVFKNYFTKRSDTHDYPTRHVSDFNLAKDKRAFSDHAIRTRVPVLWNLLSESMRNSNSVNHFRKQLKQKLILVYKWLCSFWARSCPVLYWVVVVVLCFFLCICIVFSGVGHLQASLAFQLLSNKIFCCFYFWCYLMWFSILFWWNINLNLNLNLKVLT